MTWKLQIDNERENQLYQLFYFRHLHGVDDTGVDRSADFGTRNVGIIADKYDKFFFWTTDENGNEAVPKRIFQMTPDVKGIL